MFFFMPFSSSFVSPRDAWHNGLWLLIMAVLANGRFQPPRVARRLHAFVRAIE